MTQEGIELQYFEQKVFWTNILSRLSENKYYTYNKSLDNVFASYHRK